MRSTAHAFLVRVKWFAGVCLIISWVWMVHAQEPRLREQIILPPAAGGTPASFQIEAEAKYIAAQGAFLESAAVAREINAKAVAQEIQNSVDYVKAYFARRDINIEWRKKHEWKSYQESLDLQQKAMEDRIDKDFQFTLRGDVTNELNWMLRALYVVQYMSPGDLQPLDSPLLKDDLDQIYLTDGGRAGNKLVIGLGNEQIIPTPWPFALKSSKFGDPLKEFENSRDAVIKEIQETGRAGENNTKRIWKAVDCLMLDLETVYPQEKRRDPTVFLEYNSAKIFLQSLSVQISRALKTGDRSVFDGTLNFKGSSLLDLIIHMSKRGLLFDRPHEGGERVYAALFTKMRKLHRTLTTENKEEKKEGDSWPGKN